MINFEMIMSIFITIGVLIVTYYLLLLVKSVDDTLKETDV